MRVLFYTIFVCGLLFSMNAIALICWQGGADVWATPLGPSVRTGKAGNKSSLNKARKAAYSSFILNLRKAGVDCLDKHQDGYMEFGPIRTMSAGPSTEEGQFWATVVVEVGCCVQKD